MRQITTRMEEQDVSLNTLPLDILVDGILPRLNAQSLVRVGRTCQALYSACRIDSVWRERLQKDYHVPYQGLRQQDSYALYRAILTEGAVYTWGLRDNGRLGYWPRERVTRQPVKVETAPGPTALEAGYILFHVNANPKRGWSMHTLLHDGSICYWGQGPQLSVMEPTVVKAPEPIVSCSAGRQENVCLGESGAVWKWRLPWQRHSEGPRFERVHINADDTVEIVKGGWNMTLFSLERTGIHVEFASGQVLRVPGSGADEGRAVRGLIAGENDQVVFLTHSGEVYYSRRLGSQMLLAQRMPHFSDPHARELSGAFRTFSVITERGRIMWGSLEPQTEPTQQKPRIVPALQDKGILTIAHGDWHFLALCQSGTVLAFDIDDIRTDAPPVNVPIEGFVYAIAAAGHHSGALAVKELFRSGAVAGVAVDMSLFPIDTIKSRLQAKGGFLENGGFRGLYRGMGSISAGSAPGAAIFFLSYEQSKAALAARGSVGGIPSLPSNMLASSLAETAACIVRVPTEVVKLRTQTAQYDGSWQTLQAILRSPAPLRELYRGWWSTLARELPFTCIQMPLWEYLKEKRRKWYHRPRANATDSALCGSVAGAVAAAATTPLDVIKTRVMLMRNANAADGAGWARVTANIWHEEGPRAFLRGIGPRVFWISAGGSIFLGVFDFFYHQVFANGGEQ